jgi:hypothetical protein
VVAELDDNVDEKFRQDRVLGETVQPAAARRQLIVE